MPGISLTGLVLVWKAVNSQALDFTLKLRLNARRQIAKK
jgi:hypothetical protein